jgi:hypothetical protein
MGILFFANVFFRTLLRLSAEGATSDGHLIKEGNKLRVGITQYFEVERILRCD